MGNAVTVPTVLGGTGACQPQPGDLSRQHPLYSGNLLTNVLHFWEMVHCTPWLVATAPCLPLPHPRPRGTLPSAAPRAPVHVLGILSYSWLYGKTKKNLCLFPTLPPPDKQTLKFCPAPGGVPVTCCCFWRGHNEGKRNSTWKTSPAPACWAKLLKGPTAALAEEGAFKTHLFRVTWHSTTEKPLTPSQRVHHS